MAKILVLEDDRLTREFYKILLTTAGHDVTALEDGCQGVRSLAANGFQVVITDLQMPNMGGEDVLRILRQMRPGLRDVPVVVVSSALGAGACARLVGLGAASCLDKPAGSADLLQAVAQATGRRQGA